MSESGEKHLRLRVKELICSSLNGMRIRQSLLKPYIPWTGMRVPWKAQWLGAEVWGMWSDPRARVAVDREEMESGQVREEIVIGNACGGKRGSLGIKVMLLSHA